MVNATETMLLHSSQVKNAHLAEYPEWAREFGDGEQKAAAQKAIAKCVDCASCEHK